MDSYSYKGRQSGSISSMDPIFWGKKKKEYYYLANLEFQRHSEKFLTGTYELLEESYMTIPPLSLIKS